MNKVRVFSLLMLVLVCLLSFKFKRPADEASSVKKWVSLFNGKNLKNWTPKIAGYAPGVNYGNTFRVQEGLLSVRYDQYANFKNTFGALHYNKKFSNFRLRVEYRFVGDTTPGAPSWGYRDGGIQYHGQDPSTIGISQSFPVCLEYNLHGGNGKEERPVGEICASGMYVHIGGKRNTSYCTPPAVKRTFAGDQWVVAEIEVRNGVIAHYTNGEKILEFTEPRLDSTHALGKTFIKGGNSLVKDGYISLQSNSHPMDFRRVEIMEYK